MSKAKSELIWIPLLLTVCSIFSSPAFACSVKTIKEGENYIGCELFRDDGKTVKYDSKGLTKLGCLTQCQPLEGTCSAIPSGTGTSYTSCMVSIQGGTIHRLTEILDKNKDHTPEQDCISFCQTYKRPRRELLRPGRNGELIEDERETVPRYKQKLPDEAPATS